MHQGRYGHANRGAPIEFVTLRAAAFGDFEQPPPQTWPAAATPDFPHEIRKVVFGGEPVDSLLVRRDDLGAGHTFAGPAVIVEDTATTVVPPDYDVTVDEIGSLLIRVRTAATEEIAS
jgi:N-methylhydantoinase A